MSVFIDSKPVRTPVSIWQPPEPEPPGIVRRLYLASAGENRGLINVLAAWIKLVEPRIAIVSRWHTLPPSDDLHLRMVVDRTDLERADSLMLIEPCGVNSSGEYSWAVSKGLTTIYYQDKYLSDDVLNMSLLATHRVETVGELNVVLLSICETVIGE